MNNPVNPIPEGYHTITPYLNVENAEGFICFMEQAFAAKRTERVEGPDGRIMHAEVVIGDSPLMLSEACEKAGPVPASLFLYVDDVDAVYKKALASKAESVMEPSDMFWGDRMGSIKDAWGNTWSMATHIENFAPDELKARAEAFSAREDGACSSEG